LYSEEYRTSKEEWWFTHGFGRVDLVVVVVVVVINV
jgi:hypothetical protein